MWIIIYCLAIWYTERVLLLLYNCTLFSLRSSTNYIWVFSRDVGISEFCLSISFSPYNTTDTEGNIPFIVYVLEDNDHAMYPSNVDDVSDDDIWEYTYRGNRSLVNAIMNAYNVDSRYKHSWIYGSETTKEAASDANRKG